MRHKLLSLFLCLIMLVTLTGCSLVSDMLNSMPINDEGIEDFETNCVDVDGLQKKLDDGEKVYVELQQPFDLGDGAIAITGIVKETNIDGEVSLYVMLHSSDIDMEMADNKISIDNGSKKVNSMLKTKANGKFRYYFDEDVLSEDNVLIIDNFFNKVYIKFSEDDIKEYCIETGEG